MSTVQFLPDENPTRENFNAKFSQLESLITTGSGSGGSGIYISPDEPTNGATAWYDTNDKPGSFYTAKQVDEMFAALPAGVQVDLLWENASPSSDFAAQDIVIPEMANSNVGDFIFIDTIYGTIVSAWSASQKQWLYPSCVQHENNAMIGRGRNFQLLNDTITVENGKQFADGSFVNTAYNSWLKPLKIWRIRTGVRK